MKRIYLTRHARRRMKWRGVTLAEVEKTMYQPDSVENLPSGMANAFRAIGARLVRVTYVEEEGRLVVISVVDKNR